MATEIFAECGRLVARGLGGETVTPRCSSLNASTIIQLAPILKRERNTSFSRAQEEIGFCEKVAAATLKLIQGNDALDTTVMMNTPPF